MGGEPVGVGRGIQKMRMKHPYDCMCSECPPPGVIERRIVDSGRPSREAETPRLPAPITSPSLVERAVTRMAGKPLEDRDEY